MEKKHELIKLEYDYNALEPYMDEATVKLHHDKPPPDLRGQLELGS
jgi:superoxide dismutase